MLKSKLERRGKASGFSLLELMIVVAVMMVVAAIAVPSAMRVMRSYQGSANARNIASELALAKMDAARNFTQTQLNCTLSANSCQLQMCTTKGTSTCTTFSAEGGPLLLSQGVTFSYGSIGTAAGTQTTIQNSTPIMFNSRGTPVDSTGAATGSYALYVANQSGDTYAVTVYATGKIGVWRYSNSTWVAI